MDLICPLTHEYFSVTEHAKYSADIISQVKNVIGIPLIPKFGIQINPTEVYAKAWAEAGADMIVSTGGAYMGTVVDVEKEESFGCPSVYAYLGGKSIATDQSRSNSNFDEDYKTSDLWRWWHI